MTQQTISTSTVQFGDESVELLDLSGLLDPAKVLAFSQNLEPLSNDASDE